MSRVQIPPPHSKQCIYHKNIYKVYNVYCNFTWQTKKKVEITSVILLIL